jgi:hypothetical protein
MPLQDLTDIGYQLTEHPGGLTLVNGHGRQFSYIDGETDEEMLAQEARNHVAMYEKLGQAQQVFADNYANWGNMTAQQKDTANRQAQRALSNLIRQVRRDFSSEGA